MMTGGISEDERKARIASARRKVCQARFTESRASEKTADTSAQVFPSGSHLWPVLRIVLIIPYTRFHFVTTSAYTPHHSEHCQSSFAGQGHYSEVSEESTEPEDPLEASITRRKFAQSFGLEVRLSFAAQLTLRDFASAARLQYGERKRDRDV